MRTPTCSDRRDQSRICFRTPLTVVSLDPQAPDVRPILTEGWTEDVSLSGAQIVTRVPIPDGRVWLRFVMPGAAEQLIEADIVRRSVREIGHFKKWDKQLNVYGLKFFRLITDRSVIDWVMAAVRGDREIAAPARVRQQHESLQSSR